VTDQTEPEDTCRPVDIDGETIRVRGAAEMSDEGREALAALVRAAKAKMAAEPPPVRQQLRAAAFNAVAPALRRQDEWLRLTARRNIADAVLNAIEDFLDIGDAEAWCKTCRRVWEGRHHRCDSEAEQQIAAVRTAITQLRSIHDHGDGQPHTNRERGILHTLDHITAALEQPRTTPDNPTGSKEQP